jgi:hypothetical protein
VPPAACPPFFRVPLILAALAVGLAIQWHDGEYTPSAVALIGIAIGCVAVAVGSFGSLFFLQRRGGGSKPQAVMLVLGFAIIVQLAALFIAWPSQDLHPAGGASLVAFRLGLICVTTGIVIALFTRSARLRAAAVASIVLLFVLLGFWIVHATPHPPIDVWLFERDAARELLHGRNPYAMTFPDIYHSTLPGYPQPVYGPGLVAGDRCQFGFPYPPVTLLFTTLGYLLAGDPRYAQVIALGIAGLLLAGMGRGRVGVLAMALFLFTPRVFFVLGRAWTEPFAAMLLAATIFFAIRRSKWLPVGLGLFLATKQYLVLAVPLTFFLLPEDGTWRKWIGLLARSAAVAALATLPFALWNFPAFWKSTITVQQIAPFRWDALSFIVWWGFHGHGDQVKLANYAVLPAAVASLLCLALALWRSHRGPAGFAASLSLLSLAFFAFNKQAFCNYYFFVIAALCSAIAASASPRCPDSAHWGPIQELSNDQREAQHKV